MMDIWYQDGVLKTRPGIYIDEHQKVENGWYQVDKVDIKAFPNIKRDMNGDIHILQVSECVDKQTGINSLQFFWVGEERTGLKNGELSIEIGGYFVTEKDGIIYIYTQHNGIYKWDYLNNGSIEPVAENDIYAPLVLTDCKADEYGVLNKSVSEVMSSGVMFEGYNLIGNAYRVQYTAFNSEIAWDETDDNMNETHKVHRMTYFLPETPEQLKGKTIKLTHTNHKGTAYHEVTFSSNIGDRTWEEQGEELDIDGYNKIDGLKLNCYNNQIFFADREYPEGCCLITDDEYNFYNNIEVSIPLEFSAEERARVFGATQCEWFGGGTEGIAGGTRLFLGGNTVEANKNLVAWSDLNDPLYFPENNYFRVGENSSAVTGFGKQADMLFIFKENGCGMYHIKYQQNSDISAEDLINQSVVDYIASSVYFLLVQVNPNVGCSYPETIQLCRNRLVWLGDNGNVYTLVSESQYNERSVFCVSEMVARDLKRNIKSNATACDWEGYYCLMSGNKLYLMDYNCYGYTHVASYSKTEDANIRIPWYIWELPVSGDIFTIGDTMMFSNYNDGADVETCCYLHYSLKQNNTSVDKVYIFDSAKEEMVLESRPIETLLRTKLFTFGEPSTRKNVDKINLQLGNNGGERITVKVITDQSEEEYDIYLMGTETEAYTPGYIDSKAIFPCARNVLRIGLEISSEGVVAVDGMEIKYRTTGGAR